MVPPCPCISKTAADLIDGLEFAGNAYDAATGADALVLVTEWNEFRSLDLARIKEAMRSPVFVDLRNVYRDDEVSRHGFDYVSIGRPSATAAVDKAASAE